MELAGKVAFVTGGSGDIGGAICLQLAEAGCDIALSYVGNVAGADAAVAKIMGLGRAAAPVHLDQRDPASIATAADAVIGRFGRCDILVNNAAWNIGIPFRELERLDAETWDRVLETNVRGPYLLSRELAPHLRDSGAGRIVNIASAGGLIPTSSSIAYSCSKAALIHLTHCLAVALAPEVSVNCIAPGLVEATRMAMNVPEDVVARVRAETVLGRVGSMEDIAQATEMLCRADSITGQTIVVDGGLPGAMNFG